LFYGEKQFIDVSANREMTVAVSDTGAVYQSGKLTQTTRNEKLREAIQDVFITRAFAGHDFITMLSSDGTLYAMGNNNKGQLADQSTITKVEPVVSAQLSGEKIIYYALLDEAMLLVYESKYTLWNSNNLPIPYQSSWKKMNDFNLGNERVKLIVSQSTQTLMMTENGTLFATGSNESGEIGDGSEADTSVPIPVKMNSGMRGKKAKAIDIAYPGDTNMAIADDGRLYTWGRRTSCGTGQEFSRHTPYRVDLPVNATVVQIASIQTLWVALLDNGQVYTCTRKQISNHPSYVAIKYFTRMFRFADQLGFGLISNTSQLVVFTRTARLYDIWNITSVNTIDSSGNWFAVLKPTPFNVKDIARFMLWYFDSYAVVVILKNGETYIGQNIWKKFDTVDPVVSSESVLVFANGTMMAFWATSDSSENIAGNYRTIHVPKTGDFKKLTGVARTGNGVIGIFAKCSQYFNGEDCDIPICNNLSADNRMVCSGHGRCERPDTCVCDQFYTGATCYDYSARANALIATLTVVFGLLIIIIVLMIILVSVGCTFRYRKKVAKQNQTELAMKSLLHESLIKADALSEQVDRDWVIPFSDLKFVEKLAEGSFGVVMKGRYQSADV
jgi:alpha-tubulin suppressor-like RCC1 family protein